MRAKRDQRPYNVAYKIHRAEEIARVARRQRATLELLRDLRRRPCADCDRTYPPWVMDFDHRDPATKSFSIAAGKALLRPRDVLLAEIAKCDIVCCNCHVVRTYRYLHSAAFAGRPPGQSRRLEEKRSRWRADSALLAQLRDAPCADCGGRFPFYVMQFDHRDGSSKRGLVTRMIGRAGRDRILAEAAKCDVVCGNCHRMRTYTRRQTTTIGGTAGVTQLVEFLPSKQAVAGSSPVSRSEQPVLFPSQHPFG